MSGVLAQGPGAAQYLSSFLYEHPQEFIFQQGSVLHLLRDEAPHLIAEFVAVNDGVVRDYGVADYPAPSAGPSARPDAPCCRSQCRSQMSR